MPVSAPALLKYVVTTVLLFLLAGGRIRLRLVVCGRGPDKPACAVIGAGTDVTETGACVDAATAEERQ